MDYTGKRVRLRTMPENGIHIEETATVLEDYGDGMLMVEVDWEHKQDTYDDCLRECSVDQVKEIIK